MKNHFVEEILWKNLSRDKTKNNKKNLIHFLKEIYIFHNLNSKQLQRVSNFLYKRTYEKDDYIFESNQPGAALFLIETGSIDIEIIKSEAVYTIATLKEKDCLGDMSLVDKSDRSASAKAKSKCIVYALHRKDLERMVATDPDIACQIYKSLAGLIAERLKAMNDMYKESDIGSSDDFQSAG